MNFNLTPFIHISGIGSASGLVLRDDTLYIIADSSGWLFEYDLKNHTLEKSLLFENPLNQNIPKKLKPDFEAIAIFKDDLYVFGSGSTVNRNKMANYNVSNKTVKIVNLSRLYLLMQDASQIPSDGFNIEGVVFTGEMWYFFQRGNGLSGNNGIFTIRGKSLDDNPVLHFYAYDLPKIKGIQSTFTDAVLVDNTIYFLAAAEDSKSVYDDGELFGSLIGCIDLISMEVKFSQQISGLHKFEGITLLNKSEKQIEFLLCGDNDTETLESNIYKLVLKINTMTSN